MLSHLLPRILLPAALLCSVTYPTSGVIADDKPSAKSEDGFTPLFDGMNLVAKEYVAAQDETDPGVLILSQFAGAAEEMSDALIVNPHDPQDVADAIKTALQMPLAERRKRHEALYSHLEEHDVAHWSAAFLKRLLAVEKTDPVWLERFARLELVAKTG